MTFRRDDTGTTKGGRPYRILDDRLVGGVGPLLAAVMLNEVEWVHRYPADGKHPGGRVYLDLNAPKPKENAA